MKKTLKMCSKVTMYMCLVFLIYVTKCDGYAHGGGINSDDRYSINKDRNSGLNTKTAYLSSRFNSFLNNARVQNPSHTRRTSNYHLPSLSSSHDLYQRITPSTQSPFDRKRTTSTHSPYYRKYYQNQNKKYDFVYENVTTESPFNRKYVTTSSLDKNHHQHHHKETEPPSMPYLHKHRHRRFPQLNGLLSKINGAASYNKPSWDYSADEKTTTTTTAATISKIPLAQRRFLMGNNNNDRTRALKIGSNFYNSGDYRRNSNSYLDRYSSTTKDHYGTEESDEYGDISAFNDKKTSSGQNYDDDEDFSDSGDYEDDNFYDIDDSSLELNEQAGEVTGASSITQMKWETLGTREKVDETRRQSMMRTHTLYEQWSNAAIAHVRRMLTEGACKWPKPRIVSIQTPMVGRTYSPHSTLLHRCSNDTGCCRSTSEVCVPKYSQNITLYFFVNKVKHSDVEALTFINHTECECVSNTSLANPSYHGTILPTTATQTSTMSEPSLGSLSSRNDNGLSIQPATGLKRRDVPEAKHPFRMGSLYRTMDSNQPEFIRRCQCPSMYISKMLENGVCRCECEDNNRDCRHINRGKEYFSLHDRRCIQSRECEEPACEFGRYIASKGRCPKKQERIDFSSRY